MSQLSSKYKCTMKREFVESLKVCIEQILTHPSGFQTDDDKIWASLLAEIKDRLYDKLGKWQPDYKVSFSPAQAIALRILYTDYINEPVTYLGNKLFLLSNEVAKQYN